jgi:hypothetical protein
MKLMLLHDTRGNDDSVKSFFTEVYELYTKVRVLTSHWKMNWVSGGKPMLLKYEVGECGQAHDIACLVRLLGLADNQSCIPQVLLNPFYEPTQPITSQVFQHKVKLLAKKFL